MSEIASPIAPVLERPIVARAAVEGGRIIVPDPLLPVPIAGWQPCAELRRLVSGLADRP